MICIGKQVKMKDDPFENPMDERRMGPPMENPKVSSESVTNLNSNLIIANGLVKCLPQVPV